MPSRNQDILGKLKGTQLSIGACRPGPRRISAGHRRVSGLSLVGADTYLVAVHRARDRLVTDLD